MRLRWHNINSLLLVIFALTYGIMLRRHINVSFSVLKTRSFAQYQPKEVILGFIAFFAVVLGVIALIKIFLHNGR